MMSGCTPASATHTVYVACFLMELLNSLCATIIMCDNNIHDIHESSGVHSNYAELTQSCAKEHLKWSRMVQISAS